MSVDSASRRLNREFQTVVLEALLCSVSEFDKVQRFNNSQFEVIYS